MNQDVSSYGGRDERQRLYEETRKDLLGRQLSNSQQYDRAILSLSSAFLAVSVAFIRGQDSSPITDSVWLLWSSWGAFGCAVVATIFSFMASQHAIKQQLEKAERYYLRCEEDALVESHGTGKWTSRWSWFAGIAFILGVVLTIGFAIANLPTGA